MTAAAVALPVPDSSQMLAVAEVFGPTVQGEGPSCGTPAMFVRLARCNLACSWCDTPYTWDTSRFDLRAESGRRPVSEVVEQVLRVDTPLVVVTGGEPLLQPQGLLHLVDQLACAGRRVEIETNGTVPPPAALATSGVLGVVSPKLASSGMPQARRIVSQALDGWVTSGRAVFKFVVTTVADLDEVQSLVDRYALHPVWVMPQGTTPETVIGTARVVADAVIARGWGLGVRLHILLWGDQRRR